GSLVHSDYLRFDLTHFEKIDSNQIQKIESLVNEQILNNIVLDIKLKSFDDARADGAEALFGEKYGDEVRVVQVGDYSMELCGGTHVERTGAIGSFKITEESSLSSGVRRIVALTGKKVIEKMQHDSTILKDIQHILNTSQSEIPNRIEGLLKEKKELEKKLNQKNSQTSIDIDLMANAISIGKSLLVVNQVNCKSMNELKNLGDQLFNQLKNGIGVLFMKGDDKPSAVVVVSKSLNETGIHAGNLAKEIGGFMGAGGGGKPHLATAGGRDNSSLESAMEQTIVLIKYTLEG
ncbi:MAG: alanine--tRNA ligase, partial [Candidatus Marinimicrobia bacterium]|nr:alanine--tRNA ligase [Candidatus Neomarinimicrobiota bacterium]